MNPTTDQFLTYFPEFGIANVLPVRVQFWIDVAIVQLNANRWGNLYNYGIYLYTAHKLTLENTGALAAATGGNTGRGIGPISSAAIADVSYSVDTGKNSYEGAGYWNETIYGRNFWELSKQIGAGGIQLGVNFDLATVQTGLVPV